MTQRIILRRAGGAAARCVAANPARAAGLARQRHVGDGNEPSRQRIHVHHPRSRNRPAPADGHSGQYKVLFLQGRRAVAVCHGAAEPAGRQKSIDVVNTGHWSKLAIKEARKFAEVNIVASSEDRQYTMCRTRQLAHLAGRGLSALCVQRNHRRRAVPVYPGQHCAAGVRYVVGYSVARWTCRALG